MPSACAYVGDALRDFGGKRAEHELAEHHVVHDALPVLGAVLREHPRELGTRGDLDRVRRVTPETLGRQVWEMYDRRGFALPGNAKGASAFIAQHDFMHVLGDYSTNLEGELETFALVGRADPDPKGFAWLATMVGLFETGYVHEQGFFQIDVRERKLQGTGMGTRLADAVRRGKAVAEHFGRDLFVGRLPCPRRSRRSTTCARYLHLPPKSAEAIAAGSVGLADPEGMTERQRECSRNAATADESRVPFGATRSAGEPFTVRA